MTKTAVLKKQETRLNLAIIIPFLEKYGGAERFVIECVRVWQKRHDITIYSTTFNEKLLKEHDIDLNSVKLHKLSPYIQNEHELVLNAVLTPKIWREEIGQHDLYHTHLWPTHLIDRHPMVWFPHEPLRLLHDLRFEQNFEKFSKEVGRKIHIYPKYNYDHIGNHMFDAYMNTIDKMDQTSHPERIVANSQYIAKYLEDVYHRPITDVVYPGVEAEAFMSLPIDPNLFITISQLWSHKRIKLLIEAIALTDNTQLIIIGSGPEKDELDFLIEKLGVVDRVFIMSGVNNQELKLLMARACAFLFSAIREPFGIVILEAMAAGKPIIAVKQGGYVEVCDESFAYLLPPLPSAFAEKMTYLQQHPDIAKKMGEAGKKVAAQYSWQRTADELEQLLLQTHEEARAALPDSTAEAQQKTLFGTQYYLWYGDGFGAEHWNDNPKSGYVNDKPLLGYYSSTKGETINYHLDLFEQMELDYVILNLHVDAHGANGIELVGIQHLLDIAKKRGTNIKFAVQIAPYVIDNIENVLTTVNMVNKLFKHHPNYMTLDNKPALFWFWTGILDGNKQLMSQLTDLTNGFTNIAISLRLPKALDEAKSTFNFFDGFMPFSPLELASEENWERVWHTAYENTQRAGMRYKGVTVSPGYDDTHLDDELRTGNPFRSVSRKQGKTYQQSFEFVKNLKDQPNLVMISTFNEFHENSHIEPTLRHGNKYVELTQQFIAQMRDQWK
jgi:glycosyltransferase involved in cell wall biosynthesis